DERDQVGQRQRPQQHGPVGVLHRQAERDCAPGDQSGQQHRLGQCAQEFHASMLAPRPAWRNARTAESDFRQVDPVTVGTATAGVAARRWPHLHRSPAMDSLSVFALPHALAGTLALLTFWTTAALRKGSQPHRLVGRVYLLAMVGVIVTGVPLTLGRWLGGQTVGATFLAYLLLLVTTTVWLSWRAIRDRGAPARYFGQVHAALAVANPLAGLGVLALGLSTGSALLAGFSLIGVFTGIDMWRRRRVMPARPNWWMQEH